VCDIGESYSTLKVNMASVIRMITQSSPKYTNEVLYYLVAMEQFENRYTDLSDSLKPVESTYKEIAKECYINVSGVQRCLGWLNKNGWLIMESGANRYKPTKFYVEVKKINNFMRDVKGRLETDIEKRRQYEIFKCCFDRVVRSGINNLTDIEYAVFCIIDKINKWKREGKDNPDKIRVLEYERLLKTVSKYSHVSIDDLKELFKPFKIKRNKVHIDLKQIPVERIFSYNRSDKESKVKKEWMKKVNEEEK
jgi:hypothetical protein